MVLNHSPKPRSVLFISLATPKIPTRWERYWPIRLDVDRRSVARPKQSSLQMKAADTGPPSHAHGEAPYVSRSMVTSTRSRTERTAHATCHAGATHAAPWRLPGRAW